MEKKTYWNTDRVQPVPGRRTVKNFLAAALQPVGRTLYIYGGGWNRKDTGASKEAVSLGIASCWEEFFLSQNSDYDYRCFFRENMECHKTENRYGDKGLDCSGYVGWCLYNVFETQNDCPGYVDKACSIAGNMAGKGWGRLYRKGESCSFLPGDIFSMKDHVWICLGVCEDGSIVIVHSTGSASYSGGRGGGVQLSGVGEIPQCQAVETADYFMRKYCAEWSSRYPAVWKEIQSYTYICEQWGGHFRWDSNVLYDPERYLEKNPWEILESLFF